METESVCQAHSGAGSVHMPLGSCGQSGGIQKNAICRDQLVRLDVTLAEPIDFLANFHWWCCPVGRVQASLPLLVLDYKLLVGLGLVAVYSFPALGKWPHCRLGFGFFVNVFVVLFSVPWLSALLSLPVFQMA